MVCVWYPVENRSKISLSLNILYQYIIPNYYIQCVVEYSNREVRETGNSELYLKSEPKKKKFSKTFKKSSILDPEILKCVGGKVLTVSVVLYMTRMDHIK